MKSVRKRNNRKKVKKHQKNMILKSDMDLYDTSIPIIMGGTSGMIFGQIVGIAQSACLARLVGEDINAAVLFGGYFAGTTIGGVSGIAAGTTTLMFK